MGDLANEIIAEFNRKGIPLPKAAQDYQRRGVRAFGMRNGVAEDGGGVKVDMALMDAAPAIVPVKDSTRISFRDAQLRDGRYLVSDADAQAVIDGQDARDAAYNDYIDQLNGRSVTGGAGRKFTPPSLPGYINRDDVPAIFAALRDANNTDEPSRARVGIEQLLAVATTCRARATAAQNAEEAKQAASAADYCEGLAHAAELVLTASAADYCEALAHAAGWCSPADHESADRGTSESVRDAAYDEYLASLNRGGR